MSRPVPSKLGNLRREVLTHLTQIIGISHPPSRHSVLSLMTCGAGLNTDKARLILPVPTALHWRRFAFGLLQIVCLKTPSFDVDSTVRCDEVVGRAALAGPLGPTDFGANAGKGVVTAEMCLSRSRLAVAHKSLAGVSR